MSVSPAQEAQFLADIRRNPANALILDQLAELALPQAMLTGGCLFQTIWNLAAGRSPQEQIKDYDLFYFDPSDYSAETEQAVNERLARQFGVHGISIEAANQARVHQWYEACFGEPCPPLSSVGEGIDRFLMPCACVGVGVEEGKWFLYAPYGLDDLYAGVVRPNPGLPRPALFAAKAASYAARWPALVVERV